MTASDTGHWQHVYSEKATDEVSWFQITPAPSLDALKRLGASSAQSLIDVGGGASNFVEALLDQGWGSLTVLDISAASLETARKRLGKRADEVTWVVADITHWSPPRNYDLWHDRAVFHFLTESADREAYKVRLLRALRPQGAVIMATFSPTGPDRCSGLPVRRYDAGQLATELGNELSLVDDWTEEHITPAGNRQTFTWCLFRRR